MVIRVRTMRDVAREARRSVSGGDTYGLMWIALWSCRARLLWIDIYSGQAQTICTGAIGPQTLDCRGVSSGARGGGGARSGRPIGYARSRSRGARSSRARRTSSEYRRYPRWRTG